MNIAFIVVCYCLVGLILVKYLNCITLTRSIVAFFIGPLALAALIIILAVLFIVSIIFTVIEDVCKLLRKE